MEFLRAKMCSNGSNQRQRPVSSSNWFISYWLPSSAYLLEDTLEGIRMKPKLQLQQLKTSEKYSQWIVICSSFDNLRYVNKAILYFKPVSFYYSHLFKHLL